MSFTLAFEYQIQFPKLYYQKALNFSRCLERARLLCHAIVHFHSAPRGTQLFYDNLLLSNTLITNPNSSSS